MGNGSKVDSILKDTIINLKIYTDVNGSAPFEIWLRALKDPLAKAKIRARLTRLQAGNLGDCKPLHSGVQELRLDYAQGFRVYLSRQGSEWILLLCGSFKSNQERSIKEAIKYLEDWKRRGKP
ncbi:type II toxin-antitoxin system RelE/ParE family toxin [Polynucleobacter antarcticus]|uniref:type II toxin-antitoxin system RelE/ParE family toxin n=1 Tax=Polynucleobacter antarcticus TaxID=1743162 RepID=UPI00156EF746|nr:type II toxin-antitoxin system RelE/ParE family toxin [Polynucleobacter antarcticus]